MCYGSPWKWFNSDNIWPWLLTLKELENGGQILMQFYIVIYLTWFYKWKYKVRIFDADHESKFIRVL